VFGVLNLQKRGHIDRYLIVQWAQKEQLKCDYQFFVPAKVKAPIKVGGFFPLIVDKQLVLSSFNQQYLKPRDSAMT